MAVQRTCSGSCCCCKSRPAAVASGFGVGNPSFRSKGRRSVLSRTQHDACERQVRVVEVQLQAGCSEGYVCRPRRRLSSGPFSGICSPTRTMARIHEIDAPSNFSRPGRKTFLAHRAHGRSALGERAGSAILLVLVQRSARVDPDDGQGRGQTARFCRRRGAASDLFWRVVGRGGRREGV